MNVCFISIGFSVCPQRVSVCVCFTKMAILTTVVVVVVVVVLLLAGGGGGSSGEGANITRVLSQYPRLSSFCSLVRSSSLSLSLPVSLLAVPNEYLTTPSFPPSSTSLSDLVRLHVLLRAPPTSPPPSGVLLPTLLLSTGRSSPDSSLNFSRNPLTRQISVSTTSSTATVISRLLDDSNLSIVLINSLLVPSRFGPLASESLTNSSPVNISDALTNNHGFNVFASILSASGVIHDFQRDELGAGLTIFVPTDQAFANIPSAFNFQSLSADNKGAILRFHCLRSYYPLGSLQAIVNPFQPTLATELMGAGKYTLNVTAINGSVILDTGIVRSSVTQTVFDENPVAIFGVPTVLLPKEIFGGSEVVRDDVMDGTGGAPAPEEFDAPPSPVAKVKSVATGFDGWGLGPGLACMGTLYLLV